MPSIRSTVNRVPIWIADYVLISYGTGAIMAVPAHDARDFEFAQQFELPIIAVVDPGEQPDVDRAGRAGWQRSALPATAPPFNSGPYDGLTTDEFKQRDHRRSAAAGPGPRSGQLQTARLAVQSSAILGRTVSDPARTGRRWQADRLHASRHAERLAGRLPHLDDYKPHRPARTAAGKAPGCGSIVTLDGKRYRRETNTMPQWAGSCWYYLRFIDPKNDTAFVDPEKEQAWMPVDLYVGGAEHAVLHLLYSRFWHKVLFDRGYVTHVEPFQKLVNQGMILGEMEYTAYQTATASARSASPT